MRCHGKTTPNNDSTEKIKKKEKEKTTKMKLKTNKQKTIIQTTACVFSWRWAAIFSRGWRTGRCPGMCLFLNGDRFKEI